MGRSVSEPLQRCVTYASLDYIDKVRMDVHKCRHTESGTVGSVYSSPVGSYFMNRTHTVVFLRSQGSTFVHYPNIHVNTSCPVHGPHSAPPLEENDK